MVGLSWKFVFYPSIWWLNVSQGRNPDILMRETTDAIYQVRKHHLSLHIWLGQVWNIGAVVWNLHKELPNARHNFNAEFRRADDKKSFVLNFFPQVFLIFLTETYN